MKSIQRKKQIKAVKKFRAEPDFFIRKVLGDESIEKYQKDICRLFVKHDRLAVKACHSVGKTWLLARIALSFLYCYKGAKIITTAPTYRQVVKLLWGEIRAAKKRAKGALEGKVNQVEITIDDDWYMMGFSPKTGAASDSQEQKDSSFQGFHAKYILIIFDEATGISRDVYTMAEGLQTSGKIVKWVCIANPTSRSSEFFRICKSAEWYTHTINCFDSPNLRANGFFTVGDLVAEVDILRTLTDEKRLERISNYKKPNDNLINAQWVIAKVYAWGVDHPLTKSKILGEFPDTADNTIIDYCNIFLAKTREIAVQKNPKRYIGVDVARFGDDMTVITELLGFKYIKRTVRGKLSNTEVAGLVINIINEYKDYRDVHIGIDGTGVGGGVIDILNDEKLDNNIADNVFIHELHFGQKAETEDEENAKNKEDKHRKRFANLKARMFSVLNDDLKENLTLPDEEVYEEELGSILYKFQRTGKIIIEMKSDYKARMGKSPDTADSLVLANWCRYLEEPTGKFSKITKPKTGTYSSNFSSGNSTRRKRKLKIKEY